MFYKEVIRIEFKDKKPSLYSSKLGGSFIWNSEEVPGLFLAQINLSELPSNNELPSKGWLQFFDNGYLTQTEHCVIYRDELSGRKIENNWKHSPIFKEASMEFTLNKESISCSDYKFDMNKYSDEEMEKLWQTNSGEGSKLLGYPFFCQYDPRESSKTLSEYDTLLLQIDSDDFVMFGDSGVCNYFIKSNDLKNKNFSDVFFSWDCC